MPSMSSGIVFGNSSSIDQPRIRTGPLAVSIAQGVRATPAKSLRRPSGFFTSYS